MKKLTLVLALVLAMTALAGCAGTPVIYHEDCDCPGNEVVIQTPEAVLPEGAVKTGLYIGTGLETSSAGEEGGKVKYDVTLVAVNVDDNGVITDCVIDSLPATVSFDANGSFLSDPAAPLQTKNEMGEAYGMKAYGGSKYEWNEQVAAVAQYAVGKTVEELKSGAVNESGMAADADLAATATIYIGSYVRGIEEAVNNARHLGAQADDDLRLAVLGSCADSKAAGEEAGVAQLNVDVTALTLNGDTITSCCLDALQAKVSFDMDGVVSADIPEFLTKNQLGEAYGMKAYAGSKYEWNEQAAAFAAYITGKTAADVRGIAVTETNAPAEADLASTVTIAIGGFQALVEKACQ